MKKWRCRLVASPTSPFSHIYLHIRKPIFAVFPLYQPLFLTFFFLIAFFLHHNVFAQKCNLCTPLFCIQGRPLFARLYHSNLSHPFVFPFRLLTPLSEMVQ